MYFKEIEFKIKTHLEKNTTITKKASDFIKAKNKAMSTKKNKAKNKKSAPKQSAPKQSAPKQSAPKPKQVTPNFDFQGVQITLRPNDTDAEHIVWSSKQSLLVDNARELSRQSSVKNAIQIEKWIAIHPNIPEFKNFLLVMYNKMFGYDKFKTLVEQTVAAHPRYTFGLCAYASMLQVNGNIERAFLIVAKGAGLPAMLPGRKIFSVTELINYTHVTAQILFLMKKHKAANKLIDDINPVIEHFDIADYQTFDNLLEMRKLFNISVFKEQQEKQLPNRVIA